jgi:hypothetical protein
LNWKNPELVHSARVTIYLVDLADDSDIGLTAGTAAEEAHMLKRKAVRLENGMVPFTLRGIPTLPWLTVPYFDDQSPIGIRK